jgi:hypothetical protein
MLGLVVRNNEQDIYCYIDAGDMVKGFVVRYSIPELFGYSRSASIFISVSSLKSAQTMHMLI